jgi:hypothetical protein
MNVGELQTLLALRYRAPDYALIWEVRDGTGFSTQGRQMDAMAMSLWPSRGMEVHGFELKVSRSDWLRELKQPEKAEAFHQFVDRWWVVADKDVVNVAELPKGWGLLVAKETEVRQCVQAVLQKAKPLTRTFVASVLRNLTKNYVPAMFVEQKVAAGISKAVEDRRDSNEWGLKSALEKNVEMVNTIKEFEAASGLRINNWNAGNLGAAVKIVMEHSPRKILDELDWFAKRAAVLAESIEKVRGEAETALVKHEKLESVLSESK